MTGTNGYIGLAADGHLARMRTLDKKPRRLIFEITPGDPERLSVHFRLSM